MNINSSTGRAALGLSLVALAVLGGCMVGPDYKPPKDNSPAAWSSVTNTATNAGTLLTTNSTDLAQWWGKFQDPKLTELINEALSSNLDVQIAEANLREARALRGIDAGGLWPSVTADGAASYGNFGPGGALQKSYSAGVNGVWPLDFFGATRRQLESDTAAVKAAQENIYDAQVTLTSEVALDYIQVRSAQEQIAIAQENLKSEQHTADVTRQKMGAGFDSKLDTANADAAAAATAATIPSYETMVRQNIFALSVLLGRQPADLLEDLSKPGTVPLTPPEVPAGLPSELLRRRPDIRAAEANLHAAAALIGAATADFYPQFSLTGSVNYQNSLARDLLAGPSRIWSVGPDVTWPIFSGGSTVSNVRLKKAQTDAAYLTYQKTVLTALQSVESALVAFAKEWEHREALSASVDFNRQALNLSRQLYQAGTLEFLNVLDAERSLFASQIALAQSRQAISSDLVTLYQALGGGWTETNHQRN